MLEAIFESERVDRDLPAHGRTHRLARFQEAAVTRLRRVLGRRGGAVFADAVGLGKTYVAVALIEERLRAGEDILVVIPASLREHWRRLLRPIRTPRWRLASHAQLSRGWDLPKRFDPTLIVVDEAHRFRNPETRRYAALARLVSRSTCATSRVVDADARAPDLLLLTATPVNNSAWDLYHLVRLFLHDAGLRDMGVPSLRALYDDPRPGHARLQPLVRELVVRRSRSTVEGRYGQPYETTPARAGGGADIRLPRRALPIIHRYPDGGLEDRVAGIARLQLAPYDAGAVPLARLGLLKRMDSSRAAFRATLGRLRGLLSAFIEAAEKGRLLRPADRPEHGEGDPLQLTLHGVVARPAPPDVDLESLVASARADLGSVEALLAAPGPDPKLLRLTEVLSDLGDGPVLVFSEYRDTAEAVWRALVGRFRVARIDGAGAWLGASPAGRRRVVERFAPVSNHRLPPPDRERVDVLVATDVLAEGLNLQDARHVISYDLPWNPVRLLQRIGRVDRLGAVHDLVVPHLFAPAEGLDAVLGLTRALRSKLHGIATTLDEARADELLAGLAQGPARLAASLQAAESSTDPWEALRTLWSSQGPAEERCDEAAWGELLAPQPGELAGLQAVVLLTDPAPDGHDARLVQLTTSGVEPAGTAAADAIRAALQQRPSGPDTEPHPPASRSTARLEEVRMAVRDHAETLRLLAGAPAVLPRADPAARLARLLRRGMADAGSSLDPRTVRTAERVLEALRTPLSPLVESELESLLDRAAGAADGHRDGAGAEANDLVSMAARILHRHPARTRAPTPPDWSVQAVLLVTREPG